MKFLRILISALAGAAAVYILDPRSGRRRRALLRDQMDEMQHEVEDQAEVLSRRARNRAAGTAHEIRSRLEDEPVDDSTLRARVRAEIGRQIVHAGAIDITVYNGHVTLRGPVLRNELPSLLNAVRGVPGVKDVANLLDIYESAAGIADLQG
jgi:osmotically-inducible protein OsmY